MAQVFLSWSGNRSKSLAQALKRWLPEVIQGLAVFMSDDEIEPGKRWELSLSKELQASNFGVVCLTPENLSSAWLIFEAGALSKTFDSAYLVPYRLGLKATDVGPPMSQFQGVDADALGTLKLLTAINTSIGGALQKPQLEKTFNRWWGDLEEELRKISTQVPVKVRTEREMLEEILELVRRAGSRELQETLNQILALPSVQSIKVLQRQRAGKATGEIVLLVRARSKEGLSEIPPSVYGMSTQIMVDDKKY
jgi:hypothetical protein